MNVLKRVYYHIKGENLPIYCVQTNNLVKYTTTNDDFKKGQSKRPPMEQRNEEEDLFKLEESMKRVHSQASLSSEDREHEPEFPATKEEFNNKIERRRQQLFEDMQQYYENSAESDDSDDSIF